MTYLTMWFCRQRDLAKFKKYSLANLVALCSCSIPMDLSAIDSTCPPSIRNTSPSLFSPNLALLKKSRNKHLKGPLGKAKNKKKHQKQGQNQKIQNHHQLFAKPLPAQGSMFFGFQPSRSTLETSELVKSSAASGDRFPWWFSFYTF